MTRAEYAECKRLMEWYCADPEFRENAVDGIRKRLSENGIALEPEMVLEGIRLILAGRCATEEGERNPFAREKAERDRLVSEHLQMRMSPEQYAAWPVWHYTEVVRNRCRMENREVRRHGNIYYFPLAFEVSSGCKVQCPFCGFRAKPWSENYAYTEEHRALWREILLVSKEVIGNVAGEAPCYFATEPMDNPDYEQFLGDMREIFGHVPQTTSAAAQRDPRRTRQFLQFLGEEELRERGTYRISVTSLAHFQQIMRTFTPEELEYVELLANNPESVNRYSCSGRAAVNQEHFYENRDRENRGQENRDQESRGRESRNRERQNGEGQIPGRQICEEKFLRYSIDCVAGVRVNLVEGTMMFLEPELPDEMYPLGYRVRETVTFSDAESYRAGLIHLFRSYAFDSLPLWHPVQLGRNVQMEERQGDILLLGDEIGYRMDAQPILKEIMESFREGAIPGKLLQDLHAEESGKKRILTLMQDLYERGYLVLK